MSQQINLLPSKERDWTIPAAIAGVVIVAGGTFAYAEWVRTGLAESQQQAAQARTRLAKMQSALADSQGQKRASEPTAKLEAEVVALRSRAIPATEFLQRVDDGSLGRPDGYEAELKALSTAVDDNVWVTKFSILSGGKAVSINGSAMSNEAALQFARRANEAFRGTGTTFQSLEMKPGPLSVISFTLS